jgi:hypothetical protein
MKYIMYPFFIVLAALWSAAKQLPALVAAYLLLLSVAFWWAVLILAMGIVQWPVTIAAIFYPKLKPWRYHIWVGQDNAVNALHGGNMDTNVSGRIGWHAMRGSKIALHMERFVNLLFWITKGQRDHCRQSIEPDETYHRHLGY